jgi:hypothetical protein
MVHSVIFDNGVNHMSLLRVQEIETFYTIRLETRKVNHPETSPGIIYLNKPASTLATRYDRTYLQHSLGTLPFSPKNTCGKSLKKLRAQQGTLTFFLFTNEFSLY